VKFRGYSDETLDTIDKIVSLLEKRPWRALELKTELGVYSVSYYYWIMRDMGYDVCRIRVDGASIYFICSDIDRARKMLGFTAVWR